MKNENAAGTPNTYDLQKFKYHSAGVLATVLLGPFLERPGSFSGPKANFKIKTYGIVAQFLTYKPVNFASLTHTQIVLLYHFHNY